LYRASDRHGEKLSIFSSARFGVAEQLLDTLVHVALGEQLELEQLVDKPHEIKAMAFGVSAHEP